MKTAVQMAFGKDANGKIIHISTAHNGVACSCSCIECGAPLVAKQGEVLEWHFAHAAETGCRGYNPETLLHYRAKHMFAEIAKRDGLHSLMPPGTFDIQELDKDRCLILGGPKDVNIISLGMVNVFKCLVPDKECYVKVEGTSPCGSYRPDVAVYPLPDEFKFNNSYSDCDYLKAAFVGVEIVVTHDVTDDKLRKIKDANDISMRVDLSSTDRTLHGYNLYKAIKDGASFMSYGQGYLRGEMAAEELNRGIFAWNWQKKVTARVEQEVAKWLRGYFNLDVQASSESISLTLDWC
jgi:hypothetical protein